jgi:NAD(P)-dependent dehydrogenase (short-subunit alcohol dehydrogenase family)
VTARDPAEVVIISGIGDMGAAAARRLAAGRQLVLADWSTENLERRAEAFRSEGHFVHPVHLDIANRDDVRSLAHKAANLGRVRAVFNTAGVSPVDASSQRIFDVDVLGTAYLLDEFLPFVEEGTVGVFIASMAGTMADLDPEVLRAMATTPTDQLAQLPCFDPAIDPGAAYGIAKRANQMRVQAASLTWGQRGGRVVSISPGIISTANGRNELAGASGDVMRHMVALSPVNRIGTPEDIGAVVEFLMSPQAGLITGTDILVDGGITAALRYTTGEQAAAAPTSPATG